MDVGDMRFLIEGMLSWKAQLRRFGVFSSEREMANRDNRPALLQKLPDLRLLRDDIAIFFAKRTPHPTQHWIFADDIDATYHEMKTRNANIVEDIENKPWGLRQFTIEDPDGHRFTFHLDL